jgi:hypothetical protein
MKRSLAGIDSAGDFVIHIRPANRWKGALNAFAITSEGRILPTEN